jgi:hypothetical protein
MGLYELLVQHREMPDGEWVDSAARWQISFKQGAAEASQATAAAEPASQ